MKDSVSTATVPLRQPSHRWFIAHGLVLPGLLVLLGCVALAADLPVAHWMLSRKSTGEFYKLCALAEVVAHGTGVAMIAISIYVLDPRRRRVLPIVLLASLGAGMLSNACKLVIARHRPYGFDFSGSIFDTFSGMWPLVHVNTALQGFPSSHAATAAGLAIALGWVYPRGKGLFAVFAVLGSSQRVLKGAHFISDVFWGAAMGCAVASFVIYKGAAYFAAKEPAVGDQILPADPPSLAA